MNIFYLDDDPTLAAIQHCDKHVVKMCTEMAQLLSTAHHFYGSAEVPMYKPVRMNPNIIKWVQINNQNYRYAWRMFAILNDEYTRRYKKIHKTKAIGLIDYLFRVPNNIPTATDITVPVPSVPEDCKLHFKDPDSPTHEEVQIAYRNCYNLHKSKFAKWKTGNIPEWYSVGTVYTSL